MTKVFVNLPTSDLDRAKAFYTALGCLTLSIVGLGRLTLDEILPAFGETKRSRIVALMSGSPDKAKLVARQHGLPDDAVYGYDEWDRLKQNKQVQAVYVVTPNAVHRDNVVAASGAGKHVL